MLESDAINHSNKLCHPAHDDEQQQQAAAMQRQRWHGSNTQSSRGSRNTMTGIYKYILVRRTSAYSIIIIDQVQVPCCETTYGA